MQRNFLEQFLTKISQFPQWVKEIIYVKLSEDINKDSDLAYVFATYKPVLTYKGRCELDYKKSNFDSNIYNMLNYCDQNSSISEITLNTYMSMEEIANHFLFCVDEGYMEIPDNSQILNIAGFLAGKYRTGEYFVQDGSISEEQLNSAVDNYNNNKSENKKFGQILIDLGLITQNQLNIILSIKEEAKKRFVLDHNEIPKINQEYVKTSDEYEKQIEDLKEENRQLKKKLDQLLAMVKNNE
ncbi:hypothetical protein HDR58_08800 [bacterium]|nr:hypothetical protein [bacterium]